MKSILFFIVFSSILILLSPASFGNELNEKHSCEKAISEAVCSKQREGNTYIMMSRLWRKPLKNFTRDYDIIKADKDDNIWHFWVKFTNNFIYMFELIPCNGKWYILVIHPEEVLLEHSFPSNPQKSKRGCSISN